MDYKKESLRITISLSLLAVLITIAMGVSMIDTKGNSALSAIKLMILSYSIIPSAFYFFAFIVGTASLLKSDEVGKIDGNINTEEKRRMFNYSNGIRTIISGIHASASYYLASLSDKVIKIAYIDNSPILSIVFFIFI